MQSHDASSFPSSRPADMPPNDRPPAAPPSPLDLSRLDDRQAARAIAALVDQAPHDPAILASALRAQLDLADRRHRLVMGTLAQIASLCGQLQSAAERQNRRLHLIESSLRDVCQLIREIDDPYGLGLSLDEQIAPEDDDLVN